MAQRTIVSEMIGIIPASKGDWVSGTAYAQDNQVKMYNCVLSSKHDNNTTTPMTWDGAETFTFNTEHWDVVMDGTAQFLADKDKPASTGSTGDYPYNGLGRIVLKKKYSENPDYANQPILEQSDFDDESNSHLTNTVFVVKYDFVLTEDITLGSGCVLEFEGGSISGAYTITGADTGVYVNGNYNPFSCTQAGTWSHINPADKPYTSGNGMGKVYLKKGVSFASQLTQTNTIYVIQYDFTLDANTTIPNNCILLFDGGSISGAYTLTGAKTSISAGLVKIFGTDVVISGTWNVKEVYPEWFGAAGDDSTDCSDALVSCDNTGLPICFSKGTYKFVSAVSISHTKQIKGAGTYATILKAATSNMNFILSITNKVHIENCSFYGERLAKSCLYISDAGESIIRNCTFQSAKLDNIRFSETGNNNHVVIEDCFFMTCGQVYNTGTLSGNNSRIVTITGGDDLTTLGIRTFEDFVIFEDDYLVHEIAAVTSNTLDIYPGLNTQLTGVAYKIVSGSNINIPRNGDNNNAQIVRCAFQSAAAAAIQEAGLYGSDCISNTYEGNNIGHVVGKRDNGGITYSASEINAYVENQIVDFLSAYVGRSNIRLSTKGADPFVDICYNGSTQVNIIG